MYKGLFAAILNLALQSQGKPSGTQNIPLWKRQDLKMYSLFKNDDQFQPASCWLLKTKVRTAFFLGLGLVRLNGWRQRKKKSEGSKVSNKTKACCLGFLCPNFGSTSWSGKWIMINNHAYHPILWKIWRISYDLHTTGYFTPNLE